MRLHAAMAAEFVWYRVQQCGWNKYWVSPDFLRQGLVKAFKMAAAGPGCTLQIDKESRCLNVGADFRKFTGWLGAGG